MKAMGIEKASHIITTHKHWDHSGGNEEMKKQFPGLEVHGGAHDLIPGCTHPIQDQEKFELQGMNFHCFHTPCHTKGHILYYVTTDKEHISGESPPPKVSMQNGYQLIEGIDKALFTGDTIFSGGCGRFFEGDAKGMIHAMNVAKSLPPSTQMFPGHEYTVKNLQFCHKVEPSNPEIEKKLKEAMEARQSGLFTVPSSLAEELTFNVFMRCNEKSIHDLVGSSDEVACMHFLREFKNNGTPPPKHS